MNSLAKIKENIENWNQVRHSENALSYLTAGFNFNIDRADYNEWRKSYDALADTPDDPRGKFSINVYIGVDNGRIKFYLVDSKADERENYTLNGNLFEKEFLNQNARFTAIPPLKMTDEDAFLRSFKWQTYASSWFQSKDAEWKSNPTENSGVVRAIIIPFEDLISLFSYDKDSIFCFFGLDDYTDPITGTTYLNEIELILSTIDFSEENNGVGELKFSENLTTPCPPFSIKRLKLNLIKK